MKKIWIILLCLFSVKAFAWYPDYSVMATDFVLPNDFLESSRITSIRQLALGPDFQYLYLDPIDRVFRNAASLNELTQRYFYIDIAGNQKDQEQQAESSPGPYLMDMMPYYWSPYRVNTEPKIREPLFRMAYFGKAFGETSPISLGVTLEYYYDQQPFYQPTWYWYGYGVKDAMGYSLENSPDPYNDYRQVEANNNALIQRGVSANGFVAFAINSTTSAGFKYGLFARNADGNYLNMDRHDEADWADDYLNYSRDNRVQAQDQLTHDFSGGLLRRYTNGSRFGLSAGVIFGDVNRKYTTADSTHYYYFRSVGPESYQYSESYNHGGSLDEKKWKYSGTAIYGTIHGDRVVNPDVTFRVTIFGEKRWADLNESETLWRRSSYQYYYWSDYSSSAYRYSNYSSSSLNRIGNGTYKYTHLTGSVGTEWRLSPFIRFFGGLYVDIRRDHKSANEPFLGEKFSEYSHSDQYNPAYQSLTKIDDKKFHWYRDESYSTFAVPTGIIISVGEVLEFQVGLAKVLRAIDTAEGYDLVVYHDKEIKVLENSTRTQTDSAYVEGHSFPGTNDFVEEYQMNAGISLKYKENLRITGALRNSILNPSEFKIGAEFLF